MTKHRPTLRITRGLPGSGKTTWARAWVAEDPTHRARVNRDDTAAQLHGSRLHGNFDAEKMITTMTHASVVALLQGGWDVVVDDTNLQRRHARELRRVAELQGADFEIVDFIEVPLEVCLQRNACRTGAARVPEKVIRDMHTRFVLSSYEVPLAPEPMDALDGREPYVPVPGAPKAIMVDLDGTVALMGGRSPFDETRVHEDRPNKAVIAAVRAMTATGHLAVFCSGRTDACYDATYEWVREHVGVPIEALLMRKQGDQRKDSTVKLEIFDRSIRHNYDVVAVFDDRQQVVDAWRSIGLTVFQVDRGDF